MITLKKYFNILKLALKNLLLDLKKITNKNIYKRENIIKANLDLGLYHLKLGNIKDAIFRFYIVSRFFDKKNTYSRYMLAWSYFLKKDIKKAIVEANHVPQEDVDGLGLYLSQYKSCNVIPKTIVDQYKNLTAQYIYGRYFNKELSLSKILVDELLTYLKTIPKDFKILDLGCKSGLIGAEIDSVLNKKYIIHGVEENDVLANHARLISSPDSTRIYDEIYQTNIQEYLNNNNSQYDVVIAFDSLSDRKNFQDILTKVKGLLKNNGCFIFLLKKSMVTSLSTDFVSFEYQETEIQNQISNSRFSLYSKKTYKIRKNEEYIIFLAN